MTSKQPPSPIGHVDQIRAVWDASADTYDRSPGHALNDREQWAWRRVLQRVLEPLYEGSPLRVLDVGTGTGSMATLFANMGCEVYAVDVAPRMLERAKMKAELLGVPLQLAVAIADNLPFDDDSFDVVFSRHLFWTLPEPAAALQEWVRVARTGAVIAVADGWWSEPSTYMKRRRAIGRLIRKLTRSQRRDDPEYSAVVSKQLPVIGGVSPYSIRYFLDQAGLERIRVRDLAAIRAAERHSIPPWLWVDRARHTWLATGYKAQ
jgi:ubiquinone/menaquinone biosynthesis C-methylase UbiE